MSPPEPALLQLTRRREQDRSRVKSAADSLPVCVLGKARIRATLRRLGARSAAKRNRWEAAGGWASAAKVREVVVMLSVVEAIERPGVTEDWVKLHVAPVGRPEQEKPLTAEL